MNSLLKYLNQTKFQILIIVLLTTLAYSNSLGNGLVWDDHLFLEQWPDIQSFQGLGNVLKGSAPPSQDKIFRPVRGMIYVINYSLWGANPFWYHFQALLIHLGITLLVYSIVYTVYRSWLASKKEYKIQNTKYYIPFITALLFGLHPIHTETINYISASMETWGTLFFFLSFYLYLESSSKFKVQNSKLLYAGSIVSALLAFSTYEMTLTLPILIVLYDFCFKKLKIENLKLKILRWLPYFLGIGVFLAIRTSVLGLVSRTDYLGYSFYLTQLTMVKVFVRYILLLIFPINQTAIHNLVGDFPSSMIPYDSLEPILTQSIFDKDFLLAAVLLGALILIAIKYIKRYPLISFCILWFFIALLPVSYIIPHGGAMAEKYLYISSFGFILALVYLVQNSKFKIQNFSLKLKILFFVFLITAYSLLTILRNPVWKDDISLFSDVVAKSPNNLIANYTLGIWLGKANRFAEAQEAYKRAVDKAPDFWEARFNLGNVYLKMGKFDLALDEYQHSLNLNPNLTPAKNLIANIPKMKESTSSATIAGDIVLIPMKIGDLSFSFPAHWKIAESGEKVKIEAPEGTLVVEMEIEDLGFTNNDLEMSEAPLRVEQYLKGQKQSYGKLINQGLAQIPNVDSAFVRVWDPAPDGAGQGQKQILEFYLFKDTKAIKVLVNPVSPSLMGEFDGILGSIKIN